MSKFEDLQKKIKEKGGFKTEINSFVESIEKKAEKKVEKSYNKVLVETVENLVAEVRSLLSNNNNGIKDLLDYLERKDIEIKEENDQGNKNYKAIIDGLYGLTKQFDKIQKVSITNPSIGLTQEDVKKVFDKYFQAIEKILVYQNELPSSTVVSKKDGRVTRIYEEYSTYSLTYSYTWDSNGGFKEKVTKKLL